MKLKWRKYSGDRISSPGWRASVEIPPEASYNPTVRRYGCVWEEPDGFHCYLEVSKPGQLEDEELGTFQSLEEAKEAVQSSLLKQYPRSYEARSTQRQ